MVAYCVLIVDKSMGFQRKFIHEEPVKGKQKGKLYENFQSWIRDNYGTEPTVVQWSTILKEDKDTHWDAEEDPELERSQHSSILVPMTQESSQSTELSSTQCSPQLL